MNEEKTMLEGSGEIKEKVLKLEEKILRIFFECAMYQALGFNTSLGTTFANMG